MLSTGMTTNITGLCQELPPLELLGWRWSGATLHLGFHLLLGCAGYAMHRWALIREPHA